MNCPIDAAELSMTERQGIEIDYCPKCRGVWLDRGELDKMIDRAAPEAPAHHAPAPQPPQPQPQQYQQPPQYREQPRHYTDNRHHDGHYRKKHKKEGFLGELFDF